MSLDSLSIASLPIWIQLPGLLWEFWSPMMLSKIGSVCGVPLHCDKCTLSKMKLGYAQIFVDMDVVSVFLKTIELQDEIRFSFIIRLFMSGSL